MRSSQLFLEQYNTDKIKNIYLYYYDPLIKPGVKGKVSLLELGIHKGGSFMLWHDYFPRGTVTGVDLHVPEGFMAPEQVHLFRATKKTRLFSRR